MSDIIPNVVVSMPSQLFTLARKFQAASNGKIFIGKIDTDPTLPENQIQVYLENEDGSHIPVPQPLIINQAGFPVYNGQIAKFSTTSDHSMAVYDSSGAQQFYFSSKINNVKRLYPGDKYTESLIDSDGVLLFPFDELSIPYKIFSFEKNDYLGYDVVTDQGVIEFVDGNVLLERKGFYVEGWGAKSGSDSTKSFKAAIEYARGFNSIIRSRAGDFTISERLFFGPKKESDLNTQDGFPTNVCLGFEGDNIESTKIIPSPSLSGDVLFDMTGLRNKYLKNFKVVTNKEYCPSIGILTARFNRPLVGSLSNNDWGEISNVYLGKWFSVSAYLAASTEEIKVINCKFRTDHNDSIAPFVSTSNLKDTVPSIKEAKDTELKFTEGIKSNLHQTHIGCDYYLGSTSPTFKKTGMIYIYGSQMVYIQNPFFNNNATNHDAVVVDKPPSEAYVYGIHVQNANYHQTVKSGMRLIAANVSCSLTNSNRTTSFSDAQLVIEGYTNGFFSNYLDGDIAIRSQLVNSTILSCADMKWDASKEIVNSSLGVRGKIIQSNVESRTPANNFIINMQGYPTCFINGFYSEPKKSGLSVQTDQANIAGSLSSTNYPSFNGALFKSEQLSTSLVSFSHFEAWNGGKREFRIGRGGNVILEGENSALQMRDTEGNMRKLVFHPDGRVTSSNVI